MLLVVQKVVCSVVLMVVHLVANLADSWVVEMAVYSVPQSVESLAEQ